jgi:hypothetical protein
MIRSKQHYGDYRWQASVADLELGTNRGRICSAWQILAEDDKVRSLLLPRIRQHCYNSVRR